MGAVLTPEQESFVQTLFQLDSEALQEIYEAFEIELAHRPNMTQAERDEFIIQEVLRRQSGLSNATSNQSETSGLTTLSHFNPIQGLCDERGLNHLECDYVLLTFAQPGGSWALFATWLAQTRALTAADARVELLPRNGDFGLHDVFRHTLWNALLTSYFSNEEKAKVWTDAHECLTPEGRNQACWDDLLNNMRTPPSDPALYPYYEAYNEMASRMDLNNNSVGRELVETACAQFWTLRFPVCIEDFVLNSGNSGLLVMQEMVPTPGYDCATVWARRRIDGQIVERVFTACLIPIEEHPDFPEPSEPSNPGEASTFGDPHMLTFDGKFMGIQSVGEFILARSTEDDFEVQARFKKVSDSLSANAAIAMNVAGDRVGIYARDSEQPGFYINGSAANFGSGDLFSYALPNGGMVSYASHRAD